MKSENADAAKFAAFFLFGLIFGAGLLLAPKAMAFTTSAQFGEYVCADTTGGHNKSCDDYAELDSNNSQVYGFDTYGSYFDANPHGQIGDNQLHLYMCADQYPNHFFSGPCQDTGSLNGTWTPPGRGVYRPLSELTPYFNKQAQLDDLRDFNYVNTHMEVNDLGLHLLYKVYARHVEIYNFDSSTANSNVGDIFNLNWSTDQASSVTIVSSGAAGNGTMDNVGANGNQNFTCNSNGNAHFTLQAYGPGGNGPATITRDLDVNCQGSSNPPPPPGSPPGGFSISAFCNGWPSPSVSIDANSANGADYYELYKKDNGGGQYRIAGGLSLNDLNNYTDGSVSGGNTYSYQATAWNSSGATDSNEVSVPINAGNCGSVAPPPPPPPPGNFSENSQVSFPTSIPATVTPGQVLSFTVRVKNTGATSWYHGSGYKFLQKSSLSINSTAPTNVAGLSYGHLPFAAAPGDTIDWTFNLTAPTTPGNYSLNMQMIHYAGWDYKKPDGTSQAGPSSDTWFGQSGIANFTVAAGNDAQCVSITAPSSATAGSSISGNATFKNIGSTTWKNPSLEASNYYGASTWPWPTADFSQSTASLIDSSVAPSAQTAVPFATTVPSAAGTYNLQFRMWQNGIGWFGQTCSKSIVVDPIPPSTVGFTITYSAASLNAPASVSVSNTPCSTLTVSWTYTNNGAEDGFNIYRSTDGSNWALVKFVSDTAARSWQDTPPLTDQQYYYMVRTHRAAIIPNESANSNTASGFNQSCLANLAFSNKVISKVNGNAYTTSTVIKADDAITYTINVINSGPANATINYICENPSSNLGPISNVSVTGSGAVLGTPNVSTGDSQCLSAGYSGRRLNISGTKNVANNWVITFDVTYNPDPNQTDQGKIDNNAVIFYTDGSGPHTKTVAAPSILTGGTGSGVPIFREVGS